MPHCVECFSHVQQSDISFLAFLPDVLDGLLKYNCGVKAAYTRFETTLERAHTGVNLCTIVQALQDYLLDQFPDIRKESDASVVRGVCGILVR